MDTSTGSVDASFYKPTEPPIPMMYHFTWFTWIAIIATALSILTAWYILVYRVPFNYYRLQHDHHYRLRLILVLFLLVNRITNMILTLLDYQLRVVRLRLDRERQRYQETYYYWPSRSFWPQLEGENEAIYMAMNVVHTLFIGTAFSMMMFMLFLSLDRYQRVLMVLPKSRLYYLFTLVFYIYSLSVVFMFVAYGVDFIPRGFSDGGKARDPFLTLIKYRPVIELIMLSTGIIIYYFCNIRLIITSIRGVDLSFSQIYQALFSAPPTPPQSPTLATPSQDDTEWAKRQVEIIRAQKIFVAIKMIAYLLIIICIDTAIFLVFVFASSDAVLHVSYEDVTAFVSSWIVFHVLCMFHLLDLFLKELKKSKFIALVEGPEERDKNINLKGLFRSIDSTDNSYGDYTISTPTGAIKLSMFESIQEDSLTSPQLDSASYGFENVEYSTSGRIKRSL